MIEKKITFSLKAVNIVNFGFQIPMFLLEETITKGTQEPPRSDNFYSIKLFVKSAIFSIEFQFHTNFPSDGMHWLTEIQLFKTVILLLSQHKLNTPILYNLFSLIKGVKNEQ